MTLAAAITNQQIRDTLRHRTAAAAAQPTEDYEWLLDAPLRDRGQALSLLRCITGLYGLTDQDLWAAAVQHPKLDTDPRLRRRVRIAGRLLRMLD